MTDQIVFYNDPASGWERTLAAARLQNVGYG